MKDAVNERDRIADISSASDSLYVYNTVIKRTKLAMLFPPTKTRMAPPAFVLVATAIDIMHARAHTHRKHKRVLNALQT